MIFELVIKSPAEIDAAIKKLDNTLPGLNLSFTTVEICLTNKSKEVDNLEIARKIKTKLPNIKVRSVYSIRVHGCRSRSMAVQLWDQYLIDSYRQNHKDILVVSGVPAPTQFSSIDALHYAQKYSGYGFNFGVTFNPFLNSQEEYGRLDKKITSGAVSEVFFQLGDNYLLLKKGLSYINKNYPDVKKYVSVLKPSTSILSKLKFMPWNGVFFSEKFLSSVENATEINDKLFRIAGENGGEVYLSGV